MITEIYTTFFKFVFLTPGLSDGYPDRKQNTSNQNPLIEEEQTTQWPKEKLQKNKQLSTKHTYTT
jgi:hypothetical protein